MPYCAVYCMNCRCGRGTRSDLADLALRVVLGEVPEDQFHAARELTGLPG